MKDEIVYCAEDGAKMVLRNSKYGLFYGCSNYPNCKGRHSAHQNSGKPMGIPANEETIQWRKRAHEAFDAYAKQWFTKRNDAYKFLQTTMGLNSKDGHISRFNIEQCQKLISLLK